MFRFNVVDHTTEVTLPTEIQLVHVDEVLRHTSYELAFVEAVQVNVGFNA